MNLDSAMATDSLIAEPDTLLWHFIWSRLAADPINEGLPDPFCAQNDGNDWQYMGPVNSEKGVVHQFRHRLHPRVTGRIVRHVPHPNDDVLQAFHKQRTAPLPA